MISYILYRTGALLARCLPFSLALVIARAIAWLFYISRPAVRRNVRRNFIHLGMENESIRPLFFNFAKAVTDFLRLSPDRRLELISRCSISGLEHLDKALAAGKGAILFGPHLGPWELAGAYLASIGYRMNTVALEHPSRMVTRYFSARRAEWDIRDYPAKYCSASLVKALLRGELVVLLVDRRFSRRGASVLFLGERTILPHGHIFLSQRTGAPLLPCCCYYVDGGRIEGVIKPPIRNDLEGIEKARVCAEAMEEFVREHPYQWFAFDHVWEPENEAS